MYIVIKALYPNDKAVEVAKKYIEAITKYPQDNSLTTLIVPVAAELTLQGISTMVINEVKKGKFEEAMNKTLKEVVWVLRTGNRDL